MGGAIEETKVVQRFKKWNLIMFYPKRIFLLGTDTLACKLLVYLPRIRRSLKTSYIVLFPSTFVLLWETMRLEWQ